MATTVATLVARLVADTSQFRAGLASANQSVAQSKKSMAGLSNAVGSMGKAFLAGGAIAGIALGARAVFEEMKQAESAAAQTNAVLKSTGGIANVTAKEVRDLADSIAAKSGLDDDAVVSAQNLLLTFKNVRNEVGKGNDVFKRATEAAVDLSVAGFGDMSSTAKMLGKALNDPVVGMTALSRAGVTFTAQQKETIKGLVESGDLLKAQKLMLAEVESQVGGSAKAYGNTLPGAIGKAKEALLNLGAAIGDIAVPVVKDLADGLGEVVAVGKAVSGALGGGSGGLGGAVKFLNNAFNPLMHGLNAIKAGAAALKGDVSGIGHSIVKSIPFVGALAEGTGVLGDGFNVSAAKIRKMKDEADKSTRSQRDGAGAAREHANELKKLNDEASKIVNAQLGLQGALLNVEGSAKTYADTVGELGANSLEARQAQHALQSDVVAAGQAALDASGKTQDQISTLNFLKGTLDGPAAAAITAHTLRVLGIPESKITSITADPTQAQSVIDTWIATNSNREVPIRIAISNFQSALADAASGIGAHLVP